MGGDTGPSCLALLASHVAVLMEAAHLASEVLYGFLDGLSGLEHLRAEAGLIYQL